jgi:hypothetical protein
MRGMYFLTVVAQVAMALIGFGAGAAGFPFSEFVQSILCAVVVGVLVFEFIGRPL